MQSRPTAKWSAGRRGPARRWGGGRRRPGPSSLPPWASRMRAMTAMNPTGMISQAQSGRRSHGRRKAAETIRKKRTPATRISGRELVGNGRMPMRTITHGLQGEEGEAGPHGAVEAREATAWPAATRPGTTGSRERVGPEGRRGAFTAASWRFHRHSFGSGSRSHGPSRSGSRPARPSRACGAGEGRRTSPATGPVRWGRPRPAR